MMTVDIYHVKELSHQAVTYLILISGLPDSNPRLVPDIPTFISHISPQRLHVLPLPSSFITHNHPTIFFSALYNLSNW